jgi:hypothetical protein
MDTDGHGWEEGNNKIHPRQYGFTVWQSPLSRSPINFRRHYPCSSVIELNRSGKIPFCASPRDDGAHPANPPDDRIELKRLP